ncbi:uncharacterized protein DC041_0004479 [Schistosoma bovis]|uniref:Band 7 domain-containing protein n=1 Tax=Schistosoma bovis TaxID=6184 RepID=A0A430Q8H6_SCHBO|nr:uncharacterized protein DC041_0004479 [Schistosoma bovis]
MRLPILLNRNNEQKLLIKQLNNNLISFENIESSITNYLNQTIKLLKLNIFMMDHLEQDNIEAIKSNTLLKSEETHSISKHSMVPLSHLVNTKQVKTDPLGLVIAKRKRKEMADPQIAEAILSASKLPPPIVPETTNSVDVPEELLQILALAKDYDKDDTENIDFFKNYSLIQPRKPLKTEVNNVTYMKRERLCKLSSLKKYFITKDFMEDTEETRTLVQNTVHTDEEWFMESFLHVLCILLIIITLPLSLIFCLKECLDSVTEAWGVKVERVEIKDVRLPIQLQRAMAAEAESVREATAKVIAAEGEMRASGALKAAAVEIKQHPIAMQLRYLQTVNSISSGKQSTIIFPVPLDLTSLFRAQLDNILCGNIFENVNFKADNKLQFLSNNNDEDSNEYENEQKEDLYKATGQENILTSSLKLPYQISTDEFMESLSQIECLDSVTEAWGVKVERVEIKDVRLPIQLQRAMAAEAESVREATAKVIAAEGEMRASGALKAAAVEIKQHPIAMQLRYLQTVNSISSGKQSTIIFPVPLDLTSLFRAQLDNILCGNIFENVNFKADNKLQFLSNNNDEDSNEYENEQKEDLYKATGQENILTSSLKLPYQISTDEFMESLSQIV